MITFFWFALLEGEASSDLMATAAPKPVSLPSKSRLEEVTEAANWKD
jgi:hypothetical protein